MRNCPKVINSAKPKLYRRLYQAAEEMRNNPTPAENLTWQYLKNNKTGCKFRRQHIIDRFIVDFYCIETGIVVEIDGGIHNKRIRHDKDRDKILRSLGCRVLRFKNEEVLNNMRILINKIKELSSPSPLGEGVGG